MSETLHIVCPNCDAVNRVPSARLDDAAQCGKCHRPLFEGRPIELDAARFERHAGRSDIPLLVDFWAPWCGPCQVMAPQFEDAARQLEPRMRLAKVNTEAEPSLGARFGIRSIPTMAIFRNGRELSRQSGAMQSSDIQRWARAHAAG